MPRTCVFSAEKYKVELVDLSFLNYLHLEGWTSFGCVGSLLQDGKQNKTARNPSSVYKGSQPSSFPCGGMCLGRTPVVPELAGLVYDHGPSWASA